jgi:cytidylate kinase
MKKKPLVIAIDGPAASGKGLLAKNIAERLGMVYLDTGLLYRYVGEKVRESGRDVTLAQDAASEVAGYAVKIAREEVHLEDIYIRDLSSEETGRAASIVSALPEVRKALLDFQREIAGSPKGAVLDGRDIGTVVCPGADYKFFITASLESRARRRFKQLQSMGKDVIYSTVLEDLRRRDERDMNRKVAPLICAEGAVRIDTTDMAPEEVLGRVLKTITSPAAKTDRMGS